jgi:hypothetical protein
MLPSVARDRNAGRVRTELGRVLGYILEDCIAFLDRHRKSVLGRATVVDEDEDGVRADGELANKAVVGPTVAQHPAGAMGVDHHGQCALGVLRTIGADGSALARGCERHRDRLLGAREHRAGRVGRERVDGLSAGKLSMKACVVGSSAPATGRVVCRRLPLRPPADQRHKTLKTLERAKGVEPSTLSFGTEFRARITATSRADCHTFPALCDDSSQCDIKLRSSGDWFDATSSAGRDHV